MKVKNLLFTTTFLAAASLGFARPPAVPTPNLPSPPPPALNATASPPASNATNQTASPQVALPQAAQALGDAPTNILGDLSPQCQSALLGIATSPEFLTCIPIPSLLPLLPLVADPTLIQKFIADPAHNYPPVEQPLLQFASAFCPAPKCSDKGVAGAIQAIQDGCKEDLGKKNPFIEFIFTAAVFYSPIKDITCFKFGKTFCWDETILTFINLPPSPFKITGDKTIDAIAVSDPSAACTKCNKAIVNDFFNFITDKDNELARQILATAGFDQGKLTLAQTGVAVKCGAKFEDGNIPK